MKKLNKHILIWITALAVGCTYTFPEPEELVSGSADFTKMVVMGNSLAAGFMDGVLYNDGQAASYPNLIAQQMANNGGGAFNQPFIDAEVGFYGQLPDGTIFGKLYLKGIENPLPTPTIPGDPFNPTYDGDKSALNNFAVPGMRAIDAAVPGYPNAYYTRFASNPGTSTVLGDATAANGTFFIYWLGGNDVLGYAVSGGTGSINGDGTNPIDMTPTTLFDQAFNASVDALLANGASGILATVPDVSGIPYFTTVPWNSIPLDAATAEQLNQGYAAYNQGLAQIQAGGLITAEELALRTIEFAEGDNGVVIIDNDLTDLSAQSLPSMRLTNDNDLLTLTSALFINLDDGNGGKIGITTPLDDGFSLTATEQSHISERVAAFNATIIAKVSSSGGKLALWDAYEFYETFAEEGSRINGSGIDASIFPPYGAFSLDGIHLNQRGYAFVANEFIEEINATFGSNIPLLNPNNYPGNALPVP